MNEILVDVEERRNLGKNASRRMRRDGRVPGILYGGGREPLPVSVDPRRLEEVIHGERGVNTLFHLRMAGKDMKRTVMIREFQRHPVTDRILHADFIGIEMDQKIQVRVPVLIEGVPEGIKNEGGVLDFVQREVQVECLPADIPSRFGWTSRRCTSARRSASRTCRFRRG